MNKQLQPNQATCMPTAFACVLEKPVSEVLRDLGHDGTEIIWPELGYIHGQRGFHIQELSCLAYNYGYLIAEFEAAPIMCPGDYSKLYNLVVDQFNNQIELAMHNYSGILVGERDVGWHHCMAWDHTKEEAHDPSDIDHDIKNFGIRSFYAIVKR